MRLPKIISGIAVIVLILLPCLYCLYFQVKHQMIRPEMQERLEREAVQTIVAYNFDLGFATRIVEKVNPDLTAFYTLLDNAIVRREETFNGSDSTLYEGVNSKVFSLQNAARAKVYGVQAGVEVFFTTAFSASAQANWIEGKETDDVEDKDVPLRHAPPQRQCSPEIQPQETAGRPVCFVERGNSQ